MQNVVIDEDWLRQDLAEYSEQVKAVLTREEYEHEREKLRRELLRDPRLRACIRKLDGKPSSPAKFKALATYTVSRFKAALDFKAGRKTNGKAPMRGASGEEHPPAPPPEAPVNPEIAARVIAREKAELERLRTEREEKPPPGLTRREEREWWEKRGVRPWERA